MPNSSYLQNNLGDLLSVPLVKRVKLGLHTSLLGFKNCAGSVKILQIRCRSSVKLRIKTYLDAAIIHGYSRLPRIDYEIPLLLEYKIFSRENVAYLLEYIGHERDECSISGQ